MHKIPNKIAMDPNIMKENEPNDLNLYILTIQSRWGKRINLECGQAPKYIDH